MPARRRTSAPRSPTPRRTTVVHEYVELSPSKERHIRFRLKQGDVVTVTCTASTKFYAGFFDREEFTSRVNRAGPGMFKFNYGTDEPGFTVRPEIGQDDDYYLVLRTGVFSPRAHILVDVAIERIGPVEPTIRSG